MPARLLPVAPADIETPTDPVRCCAYSAILSARACVARQRRHGARQPLRADWGVPLAVVAAGRRRGYVRLDYGCCRDCETGRAVLAALGLP